MAIVIPPMLQTSNSNKTIARGPRRPVVARPRLQRSSPPNAGALRMIKTKSWPS